MSDVWLVVGLGNPGPNYAHNRHNLGFMTVDALAARAGASFVTRSHGRALAAAVRIGVMPGGAPGPRAVLAKPQTFMNLSGGPVAELAGYFGATPDTVIVVHDDIDLPAWEIRLKRGGGEGGHNGLRDISKALGTKEYIRVRCGVGRPPGRQDAAAYVLADFPASLRPDVALLVDKAADAVERVVLEGLGAAQLAFHTPPRSPSGDRLVGGSTVPVCCVSAGESPAPTASTQAEGVVQHPPKDPGDDSPAAADGESGGPEAAREGGGQA